MTRDEQVAAEAAEMREQRAAGWTIRQIAGHHKVSNATVSRRLQDDTLDKKRGVRHGPRPSTEPDTAAMWRDWVGGMSQYEIAAKHGLSQSAVSGRMRRYREHLPDIDRDTTLQRELDVLDSVRRPLLELISGPPPPAYSNGRPMLDAEGKPVPDWSVITSAIGAVLRTQDRLAKFLGLDAPARTEVVVTEQESEAAKAQAERAEAFLSGSVVSLN